MFEPTSNNDIDAKPTLSHNEYLSRYNFVVDGPEDVVRNILDFMTIDDLITLTYGCSTFEMMVLKYLLEWDEKERVPKRLMFLLNLGINS